MQATTDDRQARFTDDDNPERPGKRRHLERQRYSELPPDEPDDRAGDSASHETPQPVKRKRTATTQRDTDEQALAPIKKRPRAAVVDEDPPEAPPRKVPKKRVVPEKPKLKETATSSPVPGDAEDSDQLAIPSPPKPRLTEVTRAKPRVAENDLNADGQKEQIIQSAPNAKDKQIDFAVVSNGKELFYGKGYQLRVMTRHHNGWPDLAVIKPDNTDVYEYDPKQGLYTINK
jgi:hypothetical protein